MKRKKNCQLCRVSQQKVCWVHFLNKSLLARVSCSATTLAALIFRMVSSLLRSSSRRSNLRSLSCGDTFFSDDQLGLFLRFFVTVVNSLSESWTKCLLGICLSLSSEHTSSASGCTGTSLENSAAAGTAFWGGVLAPEDTWLLPGVSAITGFFAELACAARMIGLYSCKIGPGGSETSCWPAALLLLGRSTAAA